MTAADDASPTHRRDELRHAAREDLFHRAALALDAGDMGVFEWTASTDELKGDRNFRRLWDLGGDAPLTGETVFARVHPDDVDMLRAEVARSVETGGDYKAQFRIRPPGGAERWLGARGRVTGRDADGTPATLTGLNWDITEAKAQEERLERLAREMNHRVNNSFAVIASLLTLGSRTARDVPSFAQMMTAQIHALADAHRLAADHALDDSDRSSDVEMRTLVETALGAWTRNAGDARIALDVDPSVSLPARHVSGMAMLLYELATNATKYGALGDAGGTLDVTVEARGDGTARFAWRERLDGPRPPLPERTGPEGTGPLPSSSGFGTVLMQHCLSLLGATMDERTVTEDGFAVAISFPHR
ncbi:MAG: sensor histidine kinase [Hasllibacter sp.]